MNEITRRAMDVFFRDAEKKAYLTAMTLTHNHHDALELVQESMLRLVQKYHGRKPEEWAPLFYRILHNGIKDWYRRQKIRQVLLGLMPWQADEEALEAQARENSAEHNALMDDELTRVLHALQRLAFRQQQTFLLRAWQEMSTRETAYALSISENSVKTHYARATHKLRQILRDEND